MVKNLPANAGGARDTGSISGLGRSPGEGNGNPLQYSCLENSVNRGAWHAIAHGVTKSRTQVSTHTLIFFYFLHLLLVGGLVTKSRPTLWDPMNCSPPVSSLLGTSQARILEWVASSFSRRSSQPRNRTHVSSALQVFSCITSGFFTSHQGSLFHLLGCHIKVSQKTLFGVVIQECPN